MAKKKAKKVVKKKATSIKEKVKQLLETKEPKKESIDLSNDEVLEIECQKIIRQSIEEEISKVLYSKQQINSEFSYKLAVLMGALKK